jgi:hypothetical protein
VGRRTAPRTATMWASNPCTGTGNKGRTDYLRLEPSEGARDCRLQHRTEWAAYFVSRASDCEEEGAALFGELAGRSWGGLGGARCRLFSIGNGDLHGRKRPALRPHFVVSSSAVSVTRHEWPERCTQRPSFTFSAPPNPPPMTARELQIRLRAAQPPTLLHVLPPEVFAAMRKRWLRAGASARLCQAVFSAKSIRVEEAAKFLRGDVSASLTENCLRCSRVKFAMVGDGQRLFLPRLADSPQFDVAAPLRKNGEAEALKYRNDFGTRKPFQSRHGPVRVPS